MSNHTKKTVALIPARGGSKGLLKKNIRPFLGKPLLAHAIEAAKSAALVDKIVVTTDDEEIAAVAREYGAETPFIRPQEISDDLATTEATLQHAVLWLDENTDFKADIVMFLTCTAVFRKNEWIDQAIQMLHDDDSLESAFVAYSTYKNFWRREDGKLKRLAADIAYASRQVREPLYREETPTTLATRADIIRNGARVGSNVEVIPTDDDRIKIDIHSEYDLWLAEKVAAEWPMDKPIH